MSDAAQTRLAATVVLARDGEAGLELFMVVRHHQIDFASGALVFPGGSLDPTDSDPRLRAVSDGVADISDEDCRLRVAAAREAFEECGVLLARPNGSDAIVDGATATALGARYRTALEAGEVGMADIAEREGLRLALDQLVAFAHWITPAYMPKRFDTHFFVAAAPLDHTLAHDGREAVDSVWITPDQAIAEADAGHRTVIFPTRLNLQKISQSRTVGDMLAHSRTEPDRAGRHRVADREQTRRAADHAHPDRGRLWGGRLRSQPDRQRCGAGQAATLGLTWSQATVHPPPRRPTSASA